jgi:hypothetical protein
MNRDINESELYQIVTCADNFRHNVFYSQVPVGDWTESRKRIDLVTFRGQDVVAIELKVRNWKEALKQAFTNLFVADYSYVALWHKSLRSVDSSLFQRTGIGLIELNGTAEVKLGADRSTYTITEKRSQLIASCNQDRMFSNGRAIA